MTEKDKTNWTPQITYELLYGNSLGFREIVKRFREWAQAQPVEPLPVTTGWCHITPEIAEHLLRRNSKNRVVNYGTVQAYAMQMAAKEWKATGQPLLFDDDNGALLDGQHRLWACYLSTLAFDTFVVTEVPHGELLFAYIDNCRARTAGDALQTAGFNGMSPGVAKVIKDLAIPSDNGQLSINPGRMQIGVRVSNRFILGYAQDNPELLKAARMVAENYTMAARVLGNRSVTIFVTWKANELFGEDVVDDFMNALTVPLDRLPEGSPIVALRKRLDAHNRATEKGKEKKMSPSMILAYVIKTFNAIAKGELLKPVALRLILGDEFPEFVDPQFEAEFTAEFSKTAAE